MLEYGITAYRGHPRSWVWPFERAFGRDRPAKRALRFASPYVDFAADDSFARSDVPQPNRLSDVRARTPLRSLSRPPRHLESHRSKRLRARLVAAARANRIFHLWWHPPNVGVDSDENLSFLRTIFEEFRRRRGEHGMRSLSMHQVDRMVRHEEHHEAQAGLLSASGNPGEGEFS